MFCKYSPIVLLIVATITIVSWLPSSSRHHFVLFVIYCLFVIKLPHGKTNKLRWPRYSFIDFLLLVWLCNWGHYQWGSSHNKRYKMIETLQSLKTTFLRLQYIKYWNFAINQTNLWNQCEFLKKLMNPNDNLRIKYNNNKNHSKYYQILLNIFVK